MDNYDNNTKSKLDDDGMQGSFAGSAAHHRSPEEAKQAVHDAVSKGVAVVAGAVEGFVDQVKQSHLPERAEEAIELAGKTTRAVAHAAVEQYHAVVDGATGGDGDGATGDNPGRGLDASRPAGAGAGADGDEWHLDRKSDDSLGI